MDLDKGGAAAGTPTGDESPDAGALGVGAPAVEDHLRRGVESGVASHALLDAWQALGGLAEHHASVLADFLHLASDPVASPNTSAALAEADALAFALLSRRGKARATSARFAEWVGDPADNVDCRDLARRVDSDGRAVGMVRTLDHGVLALLGLSGAAAAGWPLLAEALGQTPGPSDVVLVVFAPSRSRHLVLRTATAMGLTPLESRLAAAMLVELSLEDAASSLGVGRETAKDALSGAMRKTGARRAQHLIGRLIDLSCNVSAEAGSDGAVPAALGLSPAEWAVAERIAVGDTAGEAAGALGLRPGTVTTYRRSIFTKLGIARSRDLRRLMTELAELDRLGGAQQLVAASRFGGEAALRVFVDAGGRNVACLDYGPAKARPLMLMHGYSTGRTAPPPLLAALRTRGYRVVIPQRPGFGLTAPAVADYVETSVGDLALTLDRLGRGRASILARDGGVATALAFAQRHPGRLDRGVLLNPRKPREVKRSSRGPMAAVAAMLLRHPGLIEPFCAMLARQSNAEVLAGMMRRLMTANDADRACFDDPGVCGRLIDDIQHLHRSAEGIVAELRLFALGWRIPEPYDGQKWRIALSGEWATPADSRVWRHLAEGAPLILGGAGLLAQFTHAEPLAALFDD